MRRHLGFLTFFLSLLAFGHSFAQDVSINITNTSSISLGTSTPILITVCNEDPSPIDAPANKLRPQVSVPGNVTITGATNTDGSPLTEFTILSQSTGNGNTMILLLNVPLVNGECKSFNVIMKGTVVSGNTLFNATLGFQGPQTPGNITGNDNSGSGIAVTAAPPVATNDNAGPTSVPVNITVLTNDTPGSSPIDPTKVMLIDPATNAPSTNVTIAGEGTYVVNTTTGVVTFTPDPALTTPVTSTIKYTITDTNGLTSVPATITVNATPLPVTLTVFKVTKEGTIARLNWETTEETNSDYFEIQHSITGKNWNKIGLVDSHGDSKVRNVYHFTDSNPANGENLYRLKMVDKDATFAYSRIQSLKFDGVAADLSVYPNPSTDKIFIRDFSTVKEVVVSDMNGRSVYQSATFANGNGSVDVKSLAAGMYVVKVARTNGTTSAQKIVVGK